MRRARWTPEAQGDLARMDDYYRSLNVDYAVRMGRAALAAGRFLADRPEAGPIEFGDVRKWTVRGTNYVLLYRPARSGIEVMRMCDARQDWRKFRP